MAMKIGKVAPKPTFGDEEADRIIHAHKAARRIERRRKEDVRWQLAAAAASDRNLLNGKVK